MADSTLFFGIFLLFIFIGSVILFYREDDFWYKLLYMASNIVHFIFLLLISYLLIDNHFGTGQFQDTFILDKMDINNLEFVDSESYESGTLYFVYNFNNINIFEEVDIVGAHFCFYYNNSDDLPNVVRISNGVVEISDYVYLKNNTFGKECVHINKSYVYTNTLLGMICLDCSVVNPLVIPRVSTNELVSEVHITKGDPENYEFETSFTAHAFYLNITKKGGDILQEYFFYYILSLTFFIIGFGIRWGFKHYLEDLPDEIR